MDRDIDKTGEHVVLEGDTVTTRTLPILEVFQGDDDNVVDLDTYRSWRMARDIERARRTTLR